MAWLNMLYRTYEANAQMAGLPSDKTPLAPVAHIIKKVQLEVVINLQGDFVHAVPVNKKESITIIPVSEDSVSRTSKMIAPHAISDKIEYIAGDFGDYISDRKNADEMFEKYISELKKWVDSEYSHPKVKAIYRYVVKKCMISDLIKSGIKMPKESDVVRFRVQGTEPDAAWQDKTLFDSYINYYISMISSNNRDICYLSGENVVISTKHIKGVLANSGNAKLISANDKSNFTYRGRFIDSNQAYAVGYDVSQKSHNALAWLVANQGVPAGKRTYICWNPNGKEVASLDDPLGTPDDDEPRAYTDEKYKERLRDTFKGYRNKLADNDDIVVIGLDVATVKTGRLSVVYYNELMASDFYDRLQNWFETFEWYFIRLNLEKKPVGTIMTPLTFMIVNCAFGTERNGKLETDEKFFKEQYQRILHCMIDKNPIPRDIVHALMIKASTPQLYDKWYNYENVLSTACAAVAKYNYDYRSVNTDMELNYENHNRSYLFGRLLAVLEKVEQQTYKGETRETNAIRLMSAYVNHPMRTWKIIDNALNPYFQQLSPGSRYYYKNLISEITASFESDDENQLNRPLDDDYLIGYYLQRRELNKSNKNKEEK